MEQWDANTKAQIVMEGLLQGTPEAALCSRHGMSPSEYQQWREEFITHAWRVFAYPEEMRKHEETAAVLRARIQQFQLFFDASNFLTSARSQFLNRLAQAVGALQILITTHGEPRSDSENAAAAKETAVKIAAEIERLKPLRYHQQDQFFEHLPNSSPQS
jgi:transposase-like protein